jgi:hypothetical protein
VKRSPVKASLLSIFSTPNSGHGDRLNETAPFGHHFPRGRSLLLKKRFLSAMYFVSKNIEITIMLLKSITGMPA